MRDRPRKYPAEYWIEDRFTYQRTVATIRGYKASKARYESIIDISAVNIDGMPHGSTSGDTVGNKVVRAGRVKEELDAIEEAIYHVPREYRRAVWEQCVEGKDFPEDANRKTYGKWKQCFIYHTAKNLGLIWT